ncbi:MerR family DNA-binding transcriptional regulator (plasmid) [Rhizobium leguminosarum]|nr:MerR family DNA-binding transcriptional regulator [Rhizobium leguminosarum]
MDHKIQTYRIAEAASLAGVAPSTVRLWEKQGLITPNRSGQGPAAVQRWPLCPVKDYLIAQKRQRFQPGGDPRIPQKCETFTRRGHASRLGRCPSVNQEAGPVRRRNRRVETEPRRSDDGKPNLAGLHSAKTLTPTMSR